MSAKYHQLSIGDPAPWFSQASSVNPLYHFHVTAGRYVVLGFFGSGSDPLSQAALLRIWESRGLFDNGRASFFGVTLDPEDENNDHLRRGCAGIRYFWDFDETVSRLYGSVAMEDSAEEEDVVLRMWYVLDPTLHIMKIIPFRPDGRDLGELLDYVHALPPPDRFAGVELQAPVIMLPNVFEPELCGKLIGLFDEHGGTDSGVMQQVDGRTIEKKDYNYKKRSDYVVADPAVAKEVTNRVFRRVVPEIWKVHQFKATQIERLIVSRYTAKDGGHFRPHRDNTTKGTAHRRFAVSVLLNEAFEGGELSFPEYGPRSFKPPAGSAIVFSCSLLHAVSKITKGERYVFLPFLYDDEAARIRDENLQYLG